MAGGQDSALDDGRMAEVAAAAVGAAVTLEEGVVAIASAADIVMARLQGRALAARVGFSFGDQTVIATAISELARNILEYARAGTIVMSQAQLANRVGVMIVARDEGPGIADLAQALEGGHSTGRGLGFGLPGVRRLMDEFDIVSEAGCGTTVTVKKWRA